MEFQELAAHRHSLQDFCQRHAESVLAFRCRGGSFKVCITEGELDEPARHLTTTATCIESLQDCPPRYLPSSVERAWVVELGSRFAQAALEKPGKEWKSEGSAQVYCRCRSLPLIARHLDSYDPRLREHIEHIFQQLVDRPERFAVGETAPPRDDGAPENDPNKWYPPNAFHTYWTLALLEVLAEKSPKQYQEISKALALENRRKSMILWARQALAFQVSLHASESSVLDTDQLGWSLAVVLNFGEEFRFDLAEQDFIREAVRRLFQTQLDVGTWRHYRSLFHYRDAGNAYCYVFETFAVLLRVALMQTPSAQFFRQCLRDRVGDLIRLWQYADRTRIQLRREAPKLIGWCSGHRINQRDPEGWATASVFSFAQNLRRLLGIWTREEALKKLNVRIPEAAAAVNPLEKMADRADTWSQGPVGVADQLCTMFVNPIQKRGSSPETEPDDQPIAEDQARSAILFGPPGTSKTYLAGCLAAAVRWQYVEVHASDFVAEGLPQVQRTADEIFRRLMELDQTVVLFDEIDELVREREQEHDAFGRFLTTSMLPKLAELWRQRKVVYFVATNHIRYFDVAITRSQRFDALILVGPPSYSAKIKCLADHFPAACGPQFDNIEGQIDEHLKRAGIVGAEMRDKPLPDGLILAKFALLRHDQLGELAHHLCGVLRDTGETRISGEAMARALRRVADQRLRQYAPYVDLVRDAAYPRRDYQKISVCRVEGLDPNAACPPSVEKDALGGFWMTGRGGEVTAPPGYTITSMRLGKVTLVESTEGPPAAAALR